ncbi:Filamentous haemagglutinin, N-terminal [Oxalobacteraceae bacterium]
MMLRRLALALSSVLLVVPALPVTAQIIAAPDAPANQRPIVLQTSNGLPQIDITAPTAAGVSRNSFKQFDIDTGGAIINNGRNASLTELGGWVAPNPNMAAGSARVILNEVYSSDPSQLRGYLEIAGSKAELVIANPAGITCNGCGFINASRTQLMTGTPDFQGSELRGFTSGTGGLRIEGQGMDGRRVDSVTLLSQAIQINAGLWANHLSINLARTGTGDTQNDTPNPEPVFALDVAALGGMYAGKIWLVGSSHGLGVRNAGSIAGQTKLTLTLDGKLENVGRLEAEQVVVRATEIDNFATGSITGRDVAIGTQRLSNSGHPDAAPLIAADNRLEIGAKEILNTDQALIFSAGEMHIGGSLDNSDRAVGSAALLTNADATIESIGSMTIHADRLHNLNKGVTTEERRIGETTTLSYLQPQGSSEKSPISNFRWEGWSRAGRYRWITDSSQINDGILGQTPLPGVSEEYCEESAGQETCTPLAGALYLRDDPVWAYFKLAPPAEAPPSPGDAPTPPAILPPPPPANSTDQQSAEYQSWLAQKNTYDQSVANYNLAKNSYDQRVKAVDDWTADTYARREALDQAIQNYNQGFSGSYFTSWTQYINLQRSEFETIVTETHPGKIIAGGDLTLTGQDLLNDRSKLLAGGTLRGNLDNLTNIDTGGTHRIQESGTSQHTKSRWRGGFRNYHQRDWGPVLPYLPADVVTTKSLGTYQAEDKSPSVDANSLKTQAEDILQLNQSLVSLNPDIGPLLVTDPRFTQYRRWLSSDAMFTQLSYDPAMTQKRVGDGFIEQKLISEQIAELTGRRYLPGYTADEIQFAALMESGLHHAESLQLRPGIELTGEQVSRLTSDLVWLVEQEITIPGKEGQPSRTERVLIPKVYLLPRAGDLQANGTLISGERVDLLVTDTLNNSGTIVGRSAVGLDTGTLNNTGGDIGGTRVAITAIDDINNQGGSIRADSDLTLVAGRDVNLTSTTQSSRRTDFNHKTTSTATRTNLDRKASLQVSGDGNLVVYAGRDLTLAGAQVSHTGNGKTQLIAERDLQLTTVETQSSTASQSRRNSANFLRESEQSEVGTQIHAQGDVALVAGQDIRARAASISSKEGQIDIAAGRDVQTEAGQHQKEFAQGSQYKHRSITGSKTITQRFEAESSNAIETLVSGDRVSISVGEDINIKGTTVVSDRDSRLVAGSDINVSSATNTARTSSYEQVRKSGVFSGPGASVSIGTQRTENTQEISSTTQQASVIGSMQGDVTVLAGGNYRQEASQLLSPSGSVLVEANQIDVIAGVNSQDAANSSKFQQSGISIAVSNPVVNAAQTLDQLHQASSNTKDDRARLMAATAAGLTVAGTVSEIKTDPGKATEVTVSITAGSSKSESRSEQQVRVAAPSIIAGAGNVELRALGDEEAGLSIVGSQISAGNNVQLHSGSDINLTAQANTATQTSTSKSSSNSIGVAASLNKGGPGIGVAVAASRGRGSADGDDLSWTNTRIQAGNKADINAQDDIQLKGAIVEADRIIVRTDGDLDIESLQDTSRYNSKQQNISVNAVIPITGAPSAQLNAGKQKVESNYQSVIESSGLRAGDGGFDVTVGKDATLTGGVITSTDAAHDAQKNQFSSNTLTTRDINNYASYSASATNVGIGLTPFSDGKFNPKGNSAGHAEESGSNSSLTRASITGIAGDTEARTGDSEAALERIFDASRVEREVGANALIMQLFGQQASKAIGDYASSQLSQAADLRAQSGKTDDSEVRDKLIRQAEQLESRWGDSGTARVLAHALIGGLTGNVQGALGAAAGTLTAAHVGQALRDAGIDGALADGLTAIASSATGAIVGNTSGAAAAFNEVSNNYLSHPEARRYAALRDQKLLGRCDATCEGEIKSLISIDKQRDRELNACADIDTPNCNAIRQQVRFAAAEYLRASRISMESMEYKLQRSHTQNLAQDAMDGVRLNSVLGYGEAVVDGVVDLAKGTWIGLKAITGNSEARQQVRDGAKAGFDYISNPDNLPYLLGRLTPEQTEELATAYEKGDGKTVGRILGEQIASLPIASGGFGTIKVVGKGLDAASDAGKLAGKTPTHPEFIEHVIGGDFNARSRKVTGGHSLLNGDVRIVEVVSPPDVNGVYQAVVEIKRPDGQWVIKDNKTGANTMFPKDWSRERVIDEIDSAWKNKEPSNNPDKWSGTSKSGVVIEGYKSPKLTAFPVYDKGK